MKRSFFNRHALLILMVVFFFVPFGLRGARMAINNMRNEVKDWLPASFSETKDLAVFQKYFWGEGFVAISWDGCRGTVDDERFRLFVDKFFPDPAPSEDPKLRELLTNKAQYVDEELGLYARKLAADSPFSVRDCVGNRLGLYSTGNYHTNWGGQEEKWLRGDGGQWYYIKPSGDIFEWRGRDTTLARLARSVKKTLVGPTPLEGTLVANLGPDDGPWYYNNPRHLEADLFKSMITGPSLLSDLTREGGALEGDADAAMERLQGWLFGPDGKQACLLVTLSDRGRENLHRVVGRGFLGKPRGKILQLAAESGLDTPPRISAVPYPLDMLMAKPVTSGGPMVHLGGPPVDNVAIDEEGQATLVRLVGLSACLGIFISWLSFRNVPVIIMLSFVGISCALTSLSFVWWGGSVMDAVLMSMPSLVYVLALSGAVHIVNYYRDTVEERGFPGSPMEALQHGWKPCTLAAITTALGLVSLSISDILPISKFGIFSAIGVVFTLTMLFTFLPAALTLWPPRNFVSEDHSKSQSALSDWVGRFWKRVGLFAVRRHGLVTVACFGFALFAAIGLPKMQTSVRLLGLFDEQNKIYKDYVWMEQHLGKLVPMELLVWVKPDIMRASELVDEDQEEEVALAGEERFRLNFLERMEITEHITRAIDSQFGAENGDITGTAMRATSFVPPLPGDSGGSFSMRGAFSARLATYRDEISTSDYFRVVQDTNEEIWRISLRLGALKNVDYGLFVAQLKKAVEPVLAAYSYRDEILRAVDRAREGERIRGARVLLLGAPFGKSRFASERLATADPHEAPTGGGSPGSARRWQAGGRSNGDLRQHALFIDAERGTQLPALARPGIRVARELDGKTRRLRLRRGHGGRSPLQPPRIAEKRQVGGRRPPTRLSWQSQQDRVGSRRIGRRDVYRTGADRLQGTANAAA